MPIGSTRATGVVATAVVLLLVLIGDLVRVEALAGRATAQDRETTKAELLAACPDRKIDLNTFRPGAMIDDSRGNLIVVASSKRTIAVCARQPFGSTSGVAEITEMGLRGRRRVLATTGGLGDDANYLGYGRTLPGIVKIELFLPDGTAVRTDTAAETFAFLVPLPRDQMPDLTAKVTDQHGKIIYEGPL